MYPKLLILNIEKLEKYSPTDQLEVLRDYARKMEIIQLTWAKDIISGRIDWNEQKLAFLNRKNLKQKSQAS